MAYQQSELEDLNIHYYFIKDIHIVDIATECDFDLVCNLWTLGYQDNHLHFAALCSGCVASGDKKKVCGVMDGKSCD